MITDEPVRGGFPDPAFYRLPGAEQLRMAALSFLGIPISTYRANRTPGKDQAIASGRSAAVGDDGPVGGGEAVRAPGGGGDRH
ncbi:MAG: hypothetical protein ACRD0C_04400, partial [Acidimicrobiia bacterium]